MEVLKICPCYLSPRFKKNNIRILRQYQIVPSLSSVGESIEKNYDVVGCDSEGR
jgi:hypothetical protein